jgi:archaellum component FlaC
MARTRLHLSADVAGRIMIGVAAVGVVVGLAATIVGWRLVGHLSDGVDDSLQVATQSLESVDDSITVIETIIGDVRNGVGTLDRTVDNVVTVTETTSTAMTDLAEQMPALADGVESIRDGVADGTEAATTIDRTLESLDDLPGVPDYAPTRPLGETLGDLTDDLDTIAVALRTIDDDVQEVDASVALVVEDLRQAQDDLAALDRDLAASGDLLERYRRSADEATDISVRTRDDLSDDVLVTRVLIVLGGLLFTVGQIVPFWVGRSLLAESRRATLGSGEGLPPEA